MLPSHGRRSARRWTFLPAQKVKWTRRRITRQGCIGPAGTRTMARNWSASIRRAELPGFSGCERTREWHPYAGSVRLCTPRRAQGRRPAAAGVAVRTHVQTHRLRRAACGRPPQHACAQATASPGLARIIHGLPSRERRECRRFGALGPQADAGILAQYAEKAGGRKSRRSGALGARSRELMNDPGWEGRGASVRG